MLALGSASIWHANDLQSISLHLLIVENPHSRRGDGVQIFAVVAELLVIPGDKKYTLRSLQFVQGFRRLSGVNSCTIKQIAGDKDQIGFFFKIFATIRRKNPPLRTWPR